MKKRGIIEGDNPVIRYLYLFMKNIVFIFCLCFYACHSTHIPEAKNKVDYKHLPHFSSQKLLPQKFILDSIVIALPEEDILSSMNGQFFCNHDTIYFADKQLASLLLFSPEGEFIGYRLRRGNGPNEIKGLFSIVPTPEKQYIILDESWRIYTFNNSWEKINQFNIDWSSKRTSVEKYSQIDPNCHDIYEIQYSNNCLRPFSEKYLVVPIVTEHIKYNAYEKASHFYGNAYTLGLLDLSSGKISRMLCQHSPIYQRYKYIPNFQNILYDVYQDTLVFSFEADPLIYKMNLLDGKAFSFGMPGKDMNTNYRETSNFEDADKNYHRDRKKYGYYQALKYIPQTGILFRSYSKGGKAGENSLQVYQGNTLVGEYGNLPDRFQVYGYMDSWYYACAAPDFENENLIIYKFKFE
ncbi:MAG: hypothetical protein NC410_01565 [Oscillibacter sp.]|nr:hypothetical protein [Oscillibacter sp.]